MRVASLVIMCLFAVSIAQPAFAQNSGDDCISTIQGIVYQSAIPVGEIAEALGCRQLTDGRWVTGTVGSTLPYRHQVEADPAFQSPIEQTRPLVFDDLRRMFADPRLAQAFTYDLDSQTVRYPVAGGGTATYSMTGQALAPSPKPDFIGSLRRLYQVGALAFLTDPNNSALSSYAAWIMQRRDAAIMTLAKNSPLIMQGAVLDYYGYGTIPWPWQLADPFTIDAFLIWVVQTYGVPAPPPPPSTVGQNEVTYPLFIHIIDSTGALLPGACVQVSDGLSTQGACDNAPNDLDSRVGVIRIDVHPGIFTVYEETSPTGYEPEAEGQVAPVSDSATDIILIHEPVSPGQNEPGTIAYRHSAPI
jgi:hypothetical protein